MKNEIMLGLQEYWTSAEVIRAEEIDLQAAGFCSKVTMSKNGMESLVEDAMKVADLGFLPWNLAIHGPAVGIRRKGAHPYDEFIVGEYARMAGWVRQLAQLESTHRYGWVVTGLKKSRVLAGRGHYSDYQVDWWSLSRRYSPGGFLTYMGKAYKATVWKAGSAYSRLHVVLEAAEQGGRPSQVANRVIGWLVWGTNYTPKPTMDDICRAAEFCRRNGRHWNGDIKLSSHHNRRWEETSRKKVHKLCSMYDDGDHAYLAMTATYEFSVKLGDFLYDRSIMEHGSQATYQVVQNALPDKVLSVGEAAEKWMMAQLKSRTDLHDTVKAAVAWDSLIEAGWVPTSKGSVKSAIALLTEGYLGHRCSKFAAAAAAASVPGEKYADWEDRWLNRQPGEAFLDVDRIALPGGFYAAVIPKDDPIGLFVGHLVGCCQHPGGVGSSCAWHGATNANGCFLAVYNESAKPVAQSWVWQNADTVVLDNIEVSYRFKGERRELAKWYTEVILPAVKSAVAKKVVVGKDHGLELKGLPSGKGPAAPTKYTDAKKVWVYG